jgi:small subunit ribosomal protein S14
MAKKSMIAKNEQRKALVERYASRRAELVAVVKDPSTSFAEKLKAQEALAKFPRDSAKIRVKNRCVMTGRPRGYYRKFGLSRIALREEALKGHIPGVTKASW